MPYTITNPNELTDNGTNDYGYVYPNNMDLKPGSALHQLILGKLNNYARDSSSIIKKRHSAWQEIDSKLQAYIPISGKERAVLDDDPRKPVSIVFPYTYAIMETLIAYLVAAFTPEPVFRYEGVGPEDAAGATLMEKVINLHCQKTKVILNLHTLFRDVSAYGLGVTAPQWLVRRGKKVRMRTEGSYNMQGQWIESGTSKVIENTILFEGNALENIDPYCYLPDPNVALHDVQRGQYVGWVDRDNLMNLLSDEEVDGDLFNVQYLRRATNKSTSLFGTNNYPRPSRSDVLLSNSISNVSSDPVDLLHMYVNLIPSQWKLGTNEYPQKWMFTVGADAVIIRAKQLNLIHDMYPVTVAVPDFDGYSPVSYSRIEILSGMQKTIDWMFNSHVANVRKAINDVLVVDPYLINVADISEGTPGGIVRLRRPAWGRGVENSFKQLTITDITRNNVTDVTFLIEFMRQIAGTDSPVMGNLRQGGPERLTAQEFKSTNVGAVNRLERIAKIVGIQCLQDVGSMFAYHTQQFMDEPTYVKTTGQWPTAVSEAYNIQEGNRVLVKPSDILVAYDLLVRDGSIPGGNYNDTWVQLFQMISQNPVLMQTFDITKIFKLIAQNSGAKNVDAFELDKAAAKMQPATMPDEQIQQQVEAGNLGPFDVAMNSAPTNGAVA